MNLSKKSAFTLVELSIVLVILGLLVGGVLTGQSLIRAAELRSVSTQFAGYVTAVNSFKDKYFALPGDMTNATQYWGVASASPCRTAGTGTQTCDGNGDGIIYQSTASVEPLRFWQQLANGGLIEGSYDGIGHGTGPGAAYAVSAANIPKGKISNSYWSAVYLDTSAVITAMFFGTTQNVLIFGTLSGTTGSFPYGPVVKPEDAYNLDTKMDDGRPGIGKIVIYAISGVQACTDTSDQTVGAAANYLLSSPAISCSLVFNSPF